MIKKKGKWCSSLKNVKKYLLDACNFVISFLVVRWIFMNYLYFYTLGIIDFPSSGNDFWRILVIILIISFTVFNAFRILYTKRISKINVIILYILYFLSLFYLLFLKNIGLRGVNVDIIKFIIDSLTVDALVPMFNVLMFIPFGSLFKFSFKKIGIFLILVFGVECIQYIFYLGIFDTGDIFTNVIGFILGNILYDSKFGVKIRELIK